jgi:hypothetical protein
MNDHYLRSGAAVTRFQSFLGTHGWPCSVTTVLDDLELLLRRALTKRNWLAHDFFRERATQFLNPTGRERMLAEVDDCRAEFDAADQSLEQIVTPLRTAAGLTDERLREAYAQLAPTGRDG